MQSLEIFRFFDEYEHENTHCTCWMYVVQCTHFTIHSKGAAATVFASVSAAVSLFSLIYLYFVFIEREKNMWRMNKRYHVYLFWMCCVCMLFDWCVVCFAQTRIYQSHHKCNRQKRDIARWKLNVWWMRANEWHTIEWVSGRAGAQTFFHVRAHIGYSLWAHKKRTTNENYSL